MKVTVSSKFQVVIPRDIRKTHNIKPGEKMEIISYEDRIEFVPLKNIKKMRGYLKGINTSIEREDDR
jgi:AbrB family looped-hinge helix DNA binding protein